MEIKEQDEQHMVIRPTISKRFGLVVLFAFCIAWTIGVQIIPIIPIRVLFSVFGIVGILGLLRVIIGTRIIIDKSTQTFTIRRRSFFLANGQHIIPFSDVRTVRIDYEQMDTKSAGPSIAPTWQDAWKVSLDIGDKKFEIDHTTKEVDMFYLASEISRLIGSELVDNR